MKDKLPKHIAIIMDGNGRWAKARGLKRYHGHSAGVERVRDIVEEAAKIGIQELTLYAFSTENWKRPQGEISFLMQLFKTYLKQELPTFQKNQIRFRTIGNLSMTPQEIQEEVRFAEKETRQNQGMILRVALSYGGRLEILEAAQKLAQKVESGGLRPSDITEEVFAAHLYDPDMRDPDLIIRTSGEYRISNFLLWQGAYSEFWVTSVFWPDFTLHHFHQAIEDYQNRERRYGKVPSSK